MGNTNKVYKVEQTPVDEEKYPINQTMYRVESADLETLEQYVKNLDKSILESLWAYESGSDNINHTLRANQNLSNYNQFEKDIKTHIKNIERAFINAPTINHSLTVYRGIQNPDQISDISYISTSLMEDIALEFSKCCLLKITITSGCKILPLYSMLLNTLDGTGSDAEREILIYRDVTFIVTNTYKKVTDTFYGNKDITMYDITCVPKSSVKYNLNQDLLDVDKNIKISKIMENIINMFELQLLNENIVPSREDIESEFNEQVLEYNVVANDEIINDIYNRLLVKKTKRNTNY